jgi:hypothetical protein
MAVAGVERALRGRNRPSWNGYQRDENTEKAADWINHIMGLIFHRIERNHLHHCLRKAIIPTG